MSDCCCGSGSPGSVQTKWVTLVPGQFTSVAEMNPNRTSLIIQTLTGAIVLAQAPGGPLVPSPIGQAPAGIWQSITLGNGPSIFSLSKAINTDLVTQEWLAWTPSAAAGPGLPTLIAQQLNPAGSNTTQLPYTAPPGKLFAWGVSVDSVPGVISALTFVLNTLPLTQGISVVDTVSGYTLNGSLWVWDHPGGADTIKAVDTGTIGSPWVGLQLSVWKFPTPFTLDQNATASGVTADPTVTTSSPIASASEFLLGQLVNQNTNAFFTPLLLPAGWLPLLESASGVPGSFWTIFLAYGFAIGPQAITLTMRPTPAAQNWEIGLVTGQLPPTATATVVTVIEAYDVPEPEPPPTLPITLPTLSPTALATLPTLVSTVNGTTAALFAPGGAAAATVEPVEASPEPTDTDSDTDVSVPLAELEAWQALGLPLTPAEQQLEAALRAGASGAAIGTSSILMNKSILPK